MANPTRTQIEDQIKNVVDFLDDHKGNIQTLSTKYDTAVEGLIGDFVVDPVSAAIVADRRANGAVISSSIVRSMMNPLWIEYGKLEGLPYATVSDELIFELKEKIDAAGRTITQRGTVFGTVIPVSTPSGADGVISRLTEDPIGGFPLEASHAEVKTIRVVQDQNMGTRSGQEVLEFRGAKQERFIDSYLGSGLISRFTARNATDSLLGNSSFDSLETGSGLNKIPSWTINTAAGNVSRDSTVVYRPAPGVTAANSASLKFTAVDKVTQAIEVRNITLLRSTPYQLQVVLRNSVSGVTGSVTISMGSVTRVIDIGAYADTTFHVETLVFDTTLWLRNFNEESLDISIDVTALGVGDVNVDDVIFQELVPFDNTWWWPVGGAVPWLLNDEYSATDTIASDSKLAYWFWWAGYGAFPSAVSGAWTDP